MIIHWPCYCLCCHSLLCSVCSFWIEVNMCRFCNCLFISIILPFKIHLSKEGLPLTCHIFVSFTSQDLCGLYCVKWFKMRGNSLFCLILVELLNIIFKLSFNNESHIMIQCLYISNIQTFFRGISCLGMTINSLTQLSFPGAALPLCIIVTMGNGTDNISGTCQH